MNDGVELKTSELVEAAKAGKSAQVVSKKLHPSKIE